MSTLPLFGDPPEPPGSRSRGRSGNGDDGKVYRVSQLNRAVRILLEQRWADVWVRGEISDFALAASGHAYFTLNDEDEPAQLRVVIFKSDVRRSKARLDNGARVKLQGQLSLFTPRGSYQMIARIAQPEGLGELHAQFERTRQKLEAEGLLAAERKRPLPHVPRVLGVVTSLHGAALHDIIRVAHARSPVRLVIAACSVQGSDAPQSIVRALQRIQRLPTLDAVIVGRGGGAAEDLIAFNDERVARAIVDCRVPVISAVGHEVDVTIADLAADVRAATPSNAAELAVPDRRALLSELRAVQRRLERAAEVYIGRARLRVARSNERLRDPRRLLHTTRARFVACERRSLSAIRVTLRERRQGLGQLRDRLARTDPRFRLAAQRKRLVQLESRLLGLGRTLGQPERQTLARLAGQLGALSPLASLSRGYAIVLHEPSGRALLRAADAQPGDALLVRLHEGTIKARVERS
ncbi:MAG: exodeoxyribonuclease VII large subunit [Polyangiales bacterium]